MAPGLQLIHFSVRTMCIRVRAALGEKAWKLRQLWLQLPARRKLRGRSAWKSVSRRPAGGGNFDTKCEDAKGGCERLLRAARALNSPA